MRWRNEGDSAADRHAIRRPAGGLHTQSGGGFGCSPVLQGVARPRVGQSGHDRAVQSGPEQVAGVSARSAVAVQKARDFPADPGTSRLSPALHFGQIHPRTILAEIPDPLTDPFARQLAWREFYADVLWHRPEAVWTSLDERFDTQMEYANLEDPVTAAQYEAWTQGRTGYPYVDAGMRQLLTEGWMHNRLRMVTASFLIKDLHLPWQLGARWFLRHLVDADVANNQLGWQWVAGCGTDAAPYFRIFNPVTQGRRFDPDGDYIRRYVPELADVADPHEPGCSPRTTPVRSSTTGWNEMWPSRVSRRWALAHRPSERGRIPAPRQDAVIYYDSAGPKTLVSDTMWDGCPGGRGAEPQRGCQDDRDPGSGQCARNERRRVLIVDLDPQANATAGLNVADVGYTTSDVLYDGRSGVGLDAITATGWGELVDVIPAERALEHRAVPSGGTRCAACSGR